MTESTAIKNCTEGFKMLARELDCPVFLLSQFNRDPSGDKGWYTERDIYGSDGLLQDADQLWLLQNQPGITITDGQETRRVNLRRVKWRNGTLGEMDLDFHTPSSKFFRTI
jgi:replicative DNA helicase